MSPSPHRFREEVVNVQLAMRLASRGLDAHAETITRGSLPDILIDLSGLKVILEGRTEAQRAALFRDARERVVDGLADISIAIAYPRGLSTASDMNELGRKLEAARFSGEIYYADRSGIAAQAFENAQLDHIAEAINSAFRFRIQNDVVREQVAELERTIEEVVEQASATSLFFDAGTVSDRLRTALGIPTDAAETDAESD